MSTVERTINSDLTTQKDTLAATQKEIQDSVAKQLKASKDAQDKALGTYNKDLQKTVDAVQEVRAIAVPDVSRSVHSFGWR